jgi:hypothetical protein
MHSVLWRQHFEDCLRDNDRWANFLNPELVQRVPRFSKEDIKWAVSMHRRLNLERKEMQHSRVRCERQLCMDANSYEAWLMTSEHAWLETFQWRGTSHGLHGTISSM